MLFPSFQSLFGNFFRLSSESEGTFSESSLSKNSRANIFSELFHQEGWVSSWDAGEL